MKKLLLLIQLLTCFAFGFAQSSKQNFSLARKIETSPGSTEEIHLLVQGSPDKVRNEVEKLGGVYKCSSGDISSIKIQVCKVPALLKNNSVKRIEYNAQPVESLMDTAVYVINSDSVYNGMAPLSQAYDGTGVIVAIIDDGLDLTHPDFRNSLGTRVLFLWDQTYSAGSAPAPYGYGVQWNKQEIDAGSANFVHIPAGNLFHGTRVAYVACGNGDTCGIHRGVARKSDIIYVVNDGSGAHATSVEDAVDYVFHKADSLGKPCVINASFGSVVGSHDGKDLRTQFIENKLTAKHGRSFVCAAGNSGNGTFHVGYNPVSTDTSFTWVKSSGGLAYFGIWSDSANFVNLKYTIQADKTTPAFEFRGGTPYVMASNFTLGVTDSVYIVGQDTIAKVLRFLDKVNGVYGMEFAIYPDSTTYYFRISVIGPGRVDAWTRSTANNWVNNSVLPTAAVYPPMSKYVMPDSTMNIEDGFQCSPKVITVGNFQNRYKYLALDGNVYSDSVNHNEGNIAKTSSRGPTRTGLTKPDITAPGDWKFETTFMTSLASLIVTPGPNTMGAMAPCKIHRFVKTSSMTSGAAPIVTGLAALYFQMDSTADWQEVKDHITMCATKDNFTTASVPNNRWGWGKVNAFETMTGCGLFPNAVSGDTLLPGPGGDITFSPNSFTDITTIHYSMNGLRNGEITIFDVCGKKMDQIPLSAPEGSFSYSGKDLSPGIYFCRLSSGNRTISVRKMVLVK